MPELSKRAVKRALRRAWDGIKACVNAIRFKVSHEGLLHGSVLVLVLGLAAVLRLLPLRWGAYLSEFDPYWHYHVASYIVENGYPAFFTWHDPMVWYPWGRDVARNTFPGVSFTTAGLYMLLSALGAPITLWDLCIYFPVAMAVLSCLAIYFLGREIGALRWACWRPSSWQ